MAEVMERNEAIFENAGQAVHVAFLIMAQEATQDAPLRKALIRIMESIKLDSGNQRHWLDQLRGEPGGSVNFEGLSRGDIRAQCALITQAVTTNLPEIERWLLQAKYGQTDFEDVVEDDGMADVLAAPLENAVQEARFRMADAKAKLEDAGVAFRKHPDLAARKGMIDARDGLAKALDDVEAAERKVRAAQVVRDQAKSSRLIDNGPGPRTKSKSGCHVADDVRSRRRYSFSPERIAAIKGLSEWFAPMFPRIKPLALDCMLGRLFANHKKLDISARDMAAQFGSSYTTYLRASWKIKNHLRILEERALARLEPVFIEHNVINCRY